MKWRVEVLEIRHVMMNYIVEAGTEKEALAKAEAGDTTTEAPLKNHGIAERVIEKGPYAIDHQVEAAYVICAVCQLKTHWYKGSGRTRICIHDNASGSRCSASTQPLRD